MNGETGPAASGFAMPRPAPGQAEPDGTGPGGPGGPAAPGGTQPAVTEPLSPDDTVELGAEQQAQRLSAMLDEFDREFIGSCPGPPSRRSPSTWRCE